MRKALVLSSGGIDSTTCIGIAVKELGAENVATVSVFYGQKHAKELQCASNIAEKYKLPHYELDLSGILKYSNCPLLANSTEEIRHESYAEQIAKDGEGMVRTYVPFRNGLMLSSVAALAVSIFPGETVDIYLGAHADDAAGEAYADCSKEFTDAMYQAIKIGTYGQVNVVAPLVNMTKTDVVAEGIKLGIDYSMTWSCYEGGEEACGTCGTCLDRQRAFINNGTYDPINYKERIGQKVEQAFDPNC